MFGSDTDSNKKTQQFKNDNLDFLQYKSSSSKEKNHTNNMDIISDSIFEIADISIGNISNQMNVKELNIFEPKNEPNFSSIGVDIDDDFGDFEDDFGDFEDASTSQGIIGYDTVMAINTALSIPPIQNTAIISNLSIQNSTVTTNSPIQNTTIISNPPIQNTTIASNLSYINPLFSNTHNELIYDPESPNFNIYGEFNTTTTTTENFSEPTTPIDIPPNILDSKNEGTESDNLSIEHLKSPILSLNHHSKSPISIEKKEILNKLALDLINKRYFEEAYCCLQTNPLLISEQKLKVWTQLTFGENKGND